MRHRYPNEGWGETHGYAADQVGSIAVSSGVVACSLVLLRLSALMGGDAPSTAEKFVPLIPFLVVIAARFLERGAWDIDAGRCFLAVMYVGVLFIAALRGIGADPSFGAEGAAIQIGRDLMLVVFGLAVFVRDANEPRRQASIRALCWAPAVYVIANLVLYAVGVSSDRLAPDPADDPAQMLQFLGIEHLRTFFPMAVGVNTFGITIAVALSMTLVLAVVRTGGRRVFAVAGFFACICAILMTDSRGPLLAALGGAVCVLLLRRQPTGVSRLAYVVPLAPVIVIVVLSILGGYVDPSAAGRGSFASASNRLLVWEPIMNLLSNFSIEQLIGFGQFGQVTSGVAAQYAYLFPDVTYVPAAHSFMLQAVLDVGYFGLILAVLVLASLLRGFGDAMRRGSAEASVLMTGVVTLILCGFTEATPLVYSLEAYFFFLLVIAAGVAKSVGPRSDRRERRPGIRDNPRVDTLGGRLHPPESRGSQRRPMPRDLAAGRSGM